MCTKEEGVLDRVVIRQFHDKDSIDELTNLLHQAFAKGPEQPYSYPAANQDKDDTRAQIKRGKCCVAVLDGRLVGIGIVYQPKMTVRGLLYDFKYGSHLRQLAVEPGLQGRGIGTKLIDVCEQCAVEMSASELWASSPVGARQISLYRRRGYRILRYVSWQDTDYDSVVLSKCLRETTVHNIFRAMVFGMKYYLSFIMYKLGILRISKSLSVRRLGQIAFRGTVWVLSKLYLTCRPGRRPDVLLCCSNHVMADYLGPFWELFQNDPRLKFHVVFLKMSSFEHIESDLQYMRGQLPVSEVSECWARARAWDLIVCAEHCFGSASKRSPSVYIGHGPKCKVLPSEITEYAYGKHAFDRKGRLLYRRMFEEREADRDRAVAAESRLKDAIVVVGNLENDKLLAQVNRRKEFRHQLGYRSDDVVVFILSTWGEHCLWHTMGDDLLREARKLQNQFQFILSAHPHEYRPKPDGQRVWGEYLRSHREYGFVVREPSESWMSYLLACDIVLSDYTGLAEYAILLEKPIVLTPVPEKLIWKGSVTWKIRKFAPVLKNAQKLREILVAAKNNYPFEELHKLAKNINPHPGEVAERICKEIYDLLKISPPA